MKNKTTFFLVMLLLLTGASFGHECWLMSQKFNLKKDEKVNFSLLVGENFEGESWKGKILRMEHQTEKKTIDLLPLLDTTYRNFSYSFPQEGTQLVLMQSLPKWIELEADKFQAYLEEDGLTEILAYRAENKETDKKGTEIYERINKILLQVGKKTSSVHQKPVGAKLEILFLNNPYEKNKTLKAKILFDQKPLANQLVKFWKRHKGQTTKEEKKTNTIGEIEFNYTPEGNYMLSTVRMIPHSNPAEAQWHSYWGSYVFGF